MHIVILTSESAVWRLLRYLGPYHIAWWMRENGYSVQVLDFLYFLTKNQRLNLYKKYITEETKIVSFAPFSLLMKGEDQTKFFEILEEIHENFPWVKISLAGQSVRNFLSYQGYNQLKFKLDAIIEGEGEHSYLEYCNYIFGKSTKYPQFQIIGGQKVIKTSKSYDIQNCKMRYAKNDFILPNEALPLELSRGCIFKCRFCQYPHLGKDKDDFNKSMDNIRDSLIYNYENYGTTHYYLSDDTLNSHRERTIAFHKMSKSLPFKLQYTGYVRMDLLDIWPEQLEILPDSGLISCHFGIESLDPESCKIVGKGWGAKNHREWILKLKELWKDKVTLRCSLIAGLGTETEKDWQEQQDWLESVGVEDPFFAPLYLNKDLGLSEFEKEPEKYGYKFDSDGNWYTDTMDYKRAEKWCKDKGFDPKIKYPTTWYYMTLYNYGVPKKMLLEKTMWQNVQYVNANALMHRFINRYYKTAMEYQVNDLPLNI